MDLVADFQNGYMYGIVSGKNPQKLSDVGPAIQVNKVIQGFDLTNPNLQIEIMVNDHNMAQYSFIMPYSEIFHIQSICHPLSEHGVIFDVSYQVPLRRLIVEQVQHCKTMQQIEFRHDTLGWDEVWRKRSISFRSKLYQRLLVI